MFMYFDRTYVLVLIGILITAIASLNVKNSFDKYSKIKSRNGYDGYNTVLKILDYYNVNYVKIKKTKNALSDYYNPSKEIIALSEETYNDSSIASIAVAAHECGHVIQYKQGYFPIKIKAGIVPVVNFASTMSIPLIILGAFMSYNQTLINLGLILFFSVVVFQLVTLPIEFNASKRALSILNETEILDEEELVYARKMLVAAALTYVASTLATALQFLRLLILFRDRDWLDKYR